MKGPIYEQVELIESLPLGTGSMRQAMPCREDLQLVARVSQRTAAGYEVLLAHYTGMCDALIKRRSDIELAVQANNGGGMEFREELCRCDPSVGMSPCEYCAIDSALRFALSLCDEAARNCQ